MSIEPKSHEPEQPALREDPSAGRWPDRRHQAGALDDLIHRYTPEQSRDEKLRLLEAIAGHLPAPTFLWDRVANDALRGQDEELTLAALRLLAHSPLSWDRVLVTALTCQESAIQCAALDTLEVHAGHESSLAAAFGQLGDLPGWLPEAQAYWQKRWEARNAAAEARFHEDELTELSTRLAAVEADYVALANAHASAEAALAEERARVERLDHQLGVAQQLWDGLLADHEAASDKWRVARDNQAHNHHVLITAVQNELDSVRVRHRRTVSAAALAMAALVLVGGPIGFSLATRASVLAIGPEAFSATPHVQALTPNGTMLSAAREAGYAQAYVKLTQQAREQQAKGAWSKAQTTWQAAAQLATTPAQATLATQAANALGVKLRSDTPRRALALIQRPVGGARTVAPQRPAQLPQVAAPPRIPFAVPAAPADLIPGDVRDKF